jgi:hypothetical protein
MLVGLLVAFTAENPAKRFVDPHLGLLASHPEQYLEREVSLTGSVTLCHASLERWCMTDFSIAAGASTIALRLSSEAVLAPLVGTSYLPKYDDGVLVHFGCLVRVAGLFVEDPNAQGQYFLLVLSMEADR